MATQSNPSLFFFSFFVLQIAKEGKTSIFSVDDEAPVYNDGVDLEHVDEDGEHSDYDLV